MSTLFRARRALRRSTAEEAAGSLLCLLSPLWLLALAQAAGESLAIGSVAPHIVLLAVATVSWTRPGFGAVAFAAVLGSCSDVASGVPWGLEAARLGFLAAVLSSARQAWATKVPGSAVLVVGVFILLERLAYVLTTSVWLPRLDLAEALAKACCIALYTIALVPIALIVMRTLAGEVEDGRRG